MGFGARDLARAERLIQAFELEQAARAFPAAAFRWTAAARRAGSGAGGGSRAAVAGRAALGARCRFPRAHAAGPAPHAARKRRAEHRGDARSRRGHRVRRLDGSDDRWHDSADRTSAGRFPAPRRSASGRIVGSGEHSTRADCRASRGRAHRRRRDLASRMRGWRRERRGVGVHPRGGCRRDARGASGNRARAIASRERCARCRSKGRLRVSRSIADSRWWRWLLHNRQASWI